MQNWPEKTSYISVQQLSHRACRLDNHVNSPSEEYQRHHHNISLSAFPSGVALLTARLSEVTADLCELARNTDVIQKVDDSCSMCPFL